MPTSLVAVTNAAVLAIWCAGVGPALVAHTLWPTNIGAGPRRGYAFRDDPAVPAPLAAYEGGGYDRGHLAPAADFSADTNALRCTYLASNLAPMRPSFNRGRWSRVEGEARALVASAGVPMQIATIPVYGGTNRLGAVAVPSAMVKLAVRGGVCVAAWLEAAD